MKTPLQDIIDDIQKIRVLVKENELRIKAQNKELKQLTLEKLE